MNGEPTDLGSNAFLRVLRGLLRPLVRTLIARGVTLPSVYRLLKQVYVEVAESDFRLDDEPPTDSRISLLTGVHRRDVRAIRTAEDDPDAPLRQRTTLLATVVGSWLANPETRDEDGSPRPLPKAGEDEPNFESLVRAINRDVRPRTLLDELMRQGLVAEREDGLLELTPDAVLGPAEDDQKMVFFAANVGDHLAAAAENMLADQPPFLERAVFYNRLRPGSVDEIEAAARTLSQDMLVEVNRRARAYQSDDKDAPEGSHRFRFGVYFYRENKASADRPDGNED
ncbi:hypothetical protein I0K15_20835 [Pontivivens ytuae]|uniref:Uncharacterized protein n=1 Tax=Pontivivens ytuae TaxID=2789856 RepID=A0A7S9LRX1_9RHOB|nr:hypothetical protein I0K15_20835 [Pontivivens ytuae]